MGDKCTFYVVRHGQTMFNVFDKVQGWSDTPLTPAGVEMAKSLGRGMAGTNFTAAYSSDSGRAYDTARLILGGCGQGEMSVERDPRLREWCLGSLEGGPNSAFYEAMRRGWPEGSDIAQLQHALPRVCDLLLSQDTSGWAEHFETITARLREAFEDMAGKNPGGRVLVVSHAISIKTIVYLFAPERMKECEMVENASVTTLIAEDGVIRAEEICSTAPLARGRAAEDR